MTVVFKVQIEMPHQYTWALSLDELRELHQKIGEFIPRKKVQRQTTTHRINKLKKAGFKAL